MPDSPLRRLSELDTRLINEYAKFRVRAVALRDGPMSNEEVRKIRILEAEEDAGYVLDTIRLLKHPVVAEAKDTADRTISIYTQAVVGG